jgi:hypothetical protein
MSIDPTSRRAAIKGMTEAALVAAGAAALGGCAPASARQVGFTTAPTPKAGGKWDMSWIARLKPGKRVAFDTNDIQSGAALAWVDAYLAGAAEAYQTTDDISTVLVLRHASVPIAVGDDIWSRLDLGDKNKLKDPTTGETAKRNPFVAYKAGDKHSLINARSGLDTLIARGTIVLACNNALGGLVYQLAQKEKLDNAEARKQVLATLVPGVYLVPTGVFGIAAAQDAGCSCLVVR